MHHGGLSKVTSFTRSMSEMAIFQQLTLPILRKLATKGLINSDPPVVFRPQVQALGGQLSYSDRHMVLPVETSGRLGMG